jgi:hypothetical protein
MDESTGLIPSRLANLSPAAKVTLTLFLAIVGPGYLVAVNNIYWQHNKADGREGMSVDDIRAVYHGMEVEVTEEVVLESEMLEEVRPEGSMHRYLKKGGEPAIRALTRWLEDGAKESDFDRKALYAAGDPSAREVIAAQCVECHHADGGDMEDLPYAESADAQPRYELVAVTALPPAPKSETNTMVIEPISVPRLVHITHAHILSIPVFTLMVAVLFLMTGFSPSVKLVLAPLPMLATGLDFASWWLARVAEPFVYGIAAAGALFGITYGLQIVCILGSMWFGKRAKPPEKTA